MTPSPDTLKAQLSNARHTGVSDVLKAAATRHALPFSYVLAVSSRESDLKNVIGDAGHGIGMMQVDIRSWPAALQAKLTGVWKTHPEKMADLGCLILAGNLAWGNKRYPRFNAFKIAASAYNAGRGGAAAGVRGVGDSDENTTGHDYGNDVVARMGVFKELLKADGNG